MAHLPPMALADHPFGIKLTDRHLHGGSGADVLHRFLCTAPAARPAFVAVTGDVAGLPDDPGEVAPVGAIAPKPVDIDAFPDTVRAGSALP